MRVHQHSGYVQATGHPLGEQTYFGVCMNCGWQSPENRQFRADAERDVTDHVATTGIEVRMPSGLPREL